MFKGLKLIAAVIPFMAASFVFAERGNEIVGTAHDFTNKTWAGNQICQPCHTPHHAQSNAVSGRLWNHALTTQTFTLNASNTSTLPGQPATMLDRVSQMCLGCHDGVTALDAFGGSHSSNAGAATGSINLGTDLSNDHPVGLFAIYEQDRAHSGHYSYKEETVVAAAGLRLISVPLAYKRTTVNGQPANIEVPNAKVIGCTTCHNPHGGVEYSVNGTMVPGKMLLRTPAEDICISCHTK